MIYRDYVNQVRAVMGQKPLEKSSDPHKSDAKEVKKLKNEVSNLKARLQYAEYQGRK